MAGTNGEEVVDPLVQPRVIRFLKERPRLVDRGLRRELLKELENQAVERRRPDTVAEKAVQNAIQRFSEAGGRVAKEKTKQRLRKANDGPLKDL